MGQNLCSSPLKFRDGAKTLSVKMNIHRQKTIESFSGAKSTQTTSHHVSPASHWNMTTIQVLRNLNLYNINIELSNYSNICSEFANMFIIFQHFQWKNCLLQTCQNVYLLVILEAFFCHFIQ